MPRQNLRSVVEQLRRTIRSPHGDWTDAQLLERYVTAQDELAFEILVWRHGATVLGVCERLLHDTHAAEDAFQATFLVFVRKAAAIGKRESVGSWIYKVAFRVALRAKSRADQHSVPADTTQVPGSAADDPTQTLPWQELRPVLDEEVNRLPEKYRTPFVLYHLEGKNCGAVAQEIGYSKGTVSMRLAKARDLLQKRLVRRGITLAAGGLALVSEPAASASVTNDLVNATLGVAREFTGQQAALAGTVPTTVASLAEGTLNAMLRTKLKLVAALLIAVLGLGGGLGLTLHQFAVAMPLGLSSGESLTAASEPKAGDQVPPDKDGDLLAPRTKVFNLDHHGEPLPEGALARLGKLRIFPQGRVRALAFAADQKTVTTYDLAPHRWNASLGQEIQAFPQNQWPDFGLLNYAVSPDCKYAAIEGTEGLRLADLSTGKELVLKARPTEEFVHFMAFSPDNRLLATVGGSAKTEKSYVRLWQVATGQEVQSFEGGGPVAFSPDGKCLACGTLLSKENGGWVQGMRVLASFKSDRQSIRIWDLSSGKKVRQFETLAVEGHVHTLLFAPDGRTLAYHTQDDSAFHLWDVVTGKKRPFRPHLPKDQKTIAGFAFSPDGKTIATGGWDGIVRLWEVATGKERRALAGHIGYVNCLAFSPDGKKLASGSQDTTALIWDLSGRGGGKAPAGGVNFPSLWRDLAGGDAATAYRRIWQGTALPHETVAWLSKQMKPVTAVPDRDLQQALDDLDSPAFPVRKQAEDQLERWGEQIIPVLRKRLEGKPSLEVRQRGEQLLKKLEGPVTHPDLLQALRAVEVLEQIGTTEAQRVLDTLAQGATGARLTEEAKAALHRLARQSGAR